MPSVGSWRLISVVTAQKAACPCLAQPAQASSLQHPPLTDGTSTSGFQPPQERGEYFPKPNRIFKSLWWSQLTYISYCYKTFLPWMPVGGLRFRKLLSPPLCSGFAVPPKRRHNNSKDTKVRFICNYSHPQGRQQDNGLLIHHGNIPCAGEELKESTTSSCSWTGASSSLWGGRRSKHHPADCQRTAEADKEHHTWCITANEHSSPYLQSASAHTMQGFFPPSSNVTLLRLLLEAASLISFPTCSIETQTERGLFSPESPNKVCQVGC